MNAITALKKRIEREYENATTDAAAAFSDFIAALDAGTIRAVEPVNGAWSVNTWVKKGILLGFRIGRLDRIASSDPFEFFDKNTYPVKNFSLRSGVRIVPGGTTVRRGAFIASGVVIMPPAYVNVGAYVSAGTMVDSHALVGSCAFIGERVHLSAAAQIGGVLEPVGGMPVVIEDDVMVGGNCGIYEGTIIRKRAVIGTGVILNASTPVYDVVHGRTITKNDSGSIIIPEGAVVVAGSRTIDKPFATEHGLSVYAPLIVKYRDEKTDARTALEDALR